MLLLLLLLLLYSVVRCSVLHPYLIHDVRSSKYPVVHTLKINAITSCHCTFNNTFCESMTYYRVFLKINRRPHTCQSGLKAGRMKQHYGSFIDFPKNFDYKTHHISNCSGLIQPKILIEYFLVSLFNKFS